jgi:hypothetical protein
LVQTGDDLPDDRVPDGAIHQLDYELWKTHLRRQ